MGSADGPSPATTPGLKIFRTGGAAGRGPVFERMAVELRRIVGARARTPTATVRLPVGEPMDRLAALQVEAERTTDSARSRAHQAELVGLAARDRLIADSSGIADLESERRGVHERLRTAAERLRVSEQSGDFGSDFIELARSQYPADDRRAATRRRIDVRLRSEDVPPPSPAGCGA